METRGRLLLAAIAAAAFLDGALPAVLHAVPTTIHGVFNGLQPEMPNRINRDFIPSGCAVEPFPGEEAGPALWQSFAFCNTGPETCFTAVYDRGDCGFDVHLMAYVDRFDPNDLALNFVGDLGGSDSGPFSFVVPANSRFLIVAQTNVNPFEDCAFSFTIDAMRCATPAPALSPSAVALAIAMLGLIAFAAMRRMHRGLQSARLRR
jgi:hypothetical protein